MLEKDILSSQTLPWCLQKGEPGLRRVEEEIHRIHVLVPTESKRCGLCAVDALKLDLSLSFGIMHRGIWRDSEWDAIRHWLLTDEDAEGET